MGSCQSEESSSLTRTKDEDERPPRSLTGGYYWLPAKVGNTVEWSVLSCHDLGFGPDEGHYDMWPSVIDRLATAWGRDPVQLRRRLAQHCYGLPRVRVTRPDRRYLLLHGADAPVADWLGRVVRRFHLDRRSLKLLSDEHEQTFSEDRRAINEEFGLSMVYPRTEGGEARR
jgi:hypothetical protein